MSSWRLKAVGAFLGLSVCGCEEPTDIVPVTPPGAVIPRVSPDKEPAAAQGEMAAPGLATPSATGKGDYTPATPTIKGQTKTTPNGVKYETLQEGAGREAMPGQSVKVHYVGKLESGDVFDTTRSSFRWYSGNRTPAIGKASIPCRFTVSAGFNVIPKITASGNLRRMFQITAS